MSDIARVHGTYRVLPQVEKLDSMRGVNKKRKHLMDISNNTIHYRSANDTASFGQVITWYNCTSLHVLYCIVLMGWSLLSNALRPFWDLLCSPNSQTLSALHQRWSILSILLDSLRSTVVCRHESGRCSSFLPFQPIFWLLKLEAKKINTVDLQDFCIMTWHKPQPHFLINQHVKMAQLFKFWPR